MRTRLRFVLVLLTIPAAADLKLLEKIHEKVAVMLVLSDGPCDAKVVRREPEQLTVRLTSTTSTCGKRKSLVTVSRSDIHDVVDRRSVAPRQDTFESGRCVGLVSLGAVTGGQALVEATRSYRPALFLLVAGGIASAVLCHEPRRPRYAAYTDRIVPVQP
jgi:hypothetical protein